MTVQELPVSWRLTIPQGATFRRQFAWSVGGLAPDLSTWSAHMQIRRHPASETVLADLTSEADGGITLGADGTIEVLLTAAQTAELPATRGVYDLRLTQPAGGDVVPFLTGLCIITPAVTREVAP